jgi:hypothetical protein
MPTCATSFWCRCKLSVHADLQGLSALGLDRHAIKGLLTDVANSAAFGSIVAGELPHMSRGEAEDLLAEFGMLGKVLSCQQLSGMAHGTDR